MKFVNLTYHLEDRRGTWWLVYHAGEMIGLERYASEEEVVLWAIIIQLADAPAAQVTAWQDHIRKLAVKPVEQTKPVSVDEFRKQEREKLDRARGDKPNEMLSGQSIVDGLSPAASAGELSAEPAPEESLEVPGVIVGDSPSDAVPAQPTTAAGDQSQVEPAKKHSRRKHERV